ncbi:uncharacterized protein CDAR_268811 [Caerostris darwini]|uniref:Uncharacterized protein n=1 Tax=Caerostris darwini TaxID=1538125 RepID=A0AAV4R4B6_9ARAC|nr:uncharacterized protein CDAR_268811 [Caerostris darwini]
MQNHLTVDVSESYFSPLHGQLLCVRLNENRKKKQILNKISSAMYSKGHPAWALLHPIYIRQPRECEPRGPGEACLSSQLGKIVRETFLPRRTLCTEDPLPLRAWHYERSGLGCNPSFRVESLSPFGLLRLRAQQRELLTKCWLCTEKKERK